MPPGQIRLYKDQELPLSNYLELELVSQELQMVPRAAQINH